jgi:hypothetical protein
MDEMSPLLRPTLTVLSLSLAVACGGTSSGTGDGSGDGNGGADAGPGGGDGDYTPPFGECAGEGVQPPSDNAVCLVDEGADDPSTAPPLAIIEHDFTTWEGIPAVHIRIILDPKFVDNTYGDTRVGYTTGHSFKDLWESDKCEMVVLNAQGEVVFDLSIDYISQDPDADCGWASLGPFGGDGGIKVGDPDAILHWETSLSKNLNERGYCDYLENSPATDENCTPNPDAPDWDFRVVYDIWIARSAFDPVGFGSAYMSEVHASPSKRGPGQNVVQVQPEPCEGCEDVDGCGGGQCSGDGECSEYEFCYDGQCLAIVE